MRGNKVDTFVKTFQVNYGFIGGGNWQILKDVETNQELVSSMQRLNSRHETLFSVILKILPQCDNESFLRGYLSSGRLRAYKSYTTVIIKLLYRARYRGSSRERLSE